MANVPTVEITILGQRITLRSSGPDPQSVKEVIDLVNSRIRGAELRLKKNAAPHQVAVLALLDLAEQYVSARHATQTFNAKMSEKSKRLIGLLEAELHSESKSSSEASTSAPKESAAAADSARVVLPRELEASSRAPEDRSRESSL